MRNFNPKFGQSNNTNTTNNQNQPIQMLEAGEDLWI